MRLDDEISLMDSIQGCEGKTRGGGEFEVKPSLVLMFIMYTAFFRRE